MSNPEIDNPDIDHLKRHCNALAEHFDTVHIFVTRHEEGSLGGTVNAQWGAGNWFARFGQITHWLTKERKVIQNEASTPDVD